MHLGDFLEYCRLKEGLTRKELGEKMGVSERRIKTLETRSHAHREIQFIKMLQILKVPLRDIIDLHDL